MLEMGETGGGETRADHEVSSTVGGSPRDYHKAIVRLEATPTRAEALITEWRALLNARHLPGIIHVTPSMRPRSLESRLRRHAFRFGGEDAIAARPLRCSQSVTSTWSWCAIKRRSDTMNGCGPRGWGKGRGKRPRFTPHFGGSTSRLGDGRILSDIVGRSPHALGRSSFLSRSGPTPA
jgi:hypothetical protein